MRVVSLMVLGMVALCLAGCNAQKAAAPPPAPPPPAVGTQKVSEQGVVTSYGFVGRVKAEQTVALRARVQGFLEKVAFNEGDDIKEGDVLFRIEEAQFQSQLDQASANLASAKAQELNAQLTLTRSSELLKNQNAAQATVDANRANLDVAHANVMQMTAALALAKLNLSYTRVVSPINGRIGRTTYTQGNLVGPTSDVLATIISQDPIYVQFAVSVRQLEAIREARQQQDGKQTKIDIVVKLPSGKDYQHPGVWNYTDSQIDQQTDTLLMRATLPNPQHQLFDGEFVSVEVRDRKQQQRLAIPQAAVQADQSGQYVLIVDGEKKAQIKRIKTGQNQGTDVVVESGLEKDEDIIVEGAQKVRPGQVVAASPLPPKTGG